MYKPKLEEDLRCPLEYAVDVFCSKWKARIICLLDLKGSLRYKDIKKKTYHITDNVLASSLKELLEAELIERRQYNEMPLRVEYSLSEKGKTLIPLLHSICGWALQAYGEKIRPSRYGCPYADAEAQTPEALQPPDRPYESNKPEKIEETALGETNKRMPGGEGKKGIS